MRSQPGEAGGKFMRKNLQEMGDSKITSIHFSFPFLNKFPGFESSSGRIHWIRSFLPSQIYHSEVEKQTNTH